MFLLKSQICHLQHIRVQAHALETGTTRQAGNVLWEVLKKSAILLYLPATHALQRRGHGRALGTKAPVK